MADELEQRIDDLYALPLERFTPELDALAKGLAADGDRDGAARVKALRKPVVAAWAVNALAREDPQGVKALIELGEELRSAHRRAVSGRDVEPFRAATDERRLAKQSHPISLAHLRRFLRHIQSSLDLWRRDERIRVILVLAEGGGRRELLQLATAVRELLQEIST